MTMAMHLLHSGLASPSAAPHTYSSIPLHCLSSSQPNNYLPKLKCPPTISPSKPNVNQHTHASLSTTKQIHALNMKSGTIFESANQLTVLYSKNLTSLDDARKLFDKIPERTVPVYAALIRSYCRSQRWEDLFSVLGLMIYDGIRPDKFLVPTILKACSALELLRIGSMMHGFVVRNNLELDVFVGNALIDMYSNCHDLGSSVRVFDMMPEKDVVSWTALVSSYMDAGIVDEARNVFESMQLNGVKPDIISWNALSSGFARNGEIDEALHVLQVMQESGMRPGVATWNGVISGCVQNGYFEDALEMLGQMLWSSVNPNAVTLACVLPACGALQYLKLGSGIHALAFKNKIIWENIFVGGSLIDMYSKCGRRDNAERAFLEIENKNTTVYNELITAYINDNDVMSASELLHRMQTDGLEPDVVTYNTILAGYARRGEVEKAFWMFSEMIQMGLRPNIVSLNVLISGFQQCGLSKEALALFRIMQSPSSIINSLTECSSTFRCCDLGSLINVLIQPNSVTLTSALSACADLKSWHEGKQIHGYVLRNQFEPSIFVMSALIDMYAKCSDMNSATKVFYRIDKKNVVCWNTLMAGHINNAAQEEALNLFTEMLEIGIVPSSVTLEIILATFTHTAPDSQGRALHGFTLKYGDDSLSCSVGDMYTNEESPV